MTHEWTVEDTVEFLCTEIEKQEYPEFYTDHDLVSRLFTTDLVGNRSQQHSEHGEFEGTYEPIPEWVISSRENQEQPESCSLCNFNLACISSREGVDDTCLWRCCGPETDIESEFVCTSCTYDGIHCSECGLSEKYFFNSQQSRYYSYRGEWIEYSTAWSFIKETLTNNHLCPQCAVEFGIIEHDEFDIIEEHLTSNGSYFNSIHDENGTYYGEYENEEPIEDNSEKMKEVKKAIQEVGEYVFILQDKLSEGEYLKLMNLLQNVTNVANS